jgi:hypothetical protein
VLTFEMLSDECGEVYEIIDEDANNTLWTTGIKWILRLRQAAESN